MKMEEYLAQEPKTSELELFKVLVDRNLSIQKQLHSSYHGDKHLRDLLMKGVKLPTIPEVLTDRKPRTSHQLMERVANKRIPKPGRAGTSVSLLCSQEKVKDKVTEKEQAFYCLGQI